MNKILLLTILSTTQMTCTMNQETTTRPATSVLSVIVDVTEQHQNRPSIPQLLQQYHCVRTPDDECIFRMRTISDRTLTPIVTYHLADAERMEEDNADDPQYRNKCIRTFYHKIEKAVSGLYTAADTLHTLNNSECIYTISNELTYLAEHKGDETTLVIASDLMEKSGIANFYTEPLYAPHLAGLLERMRVFPDDLSGMTIIFLFTPKDRNEDQLFSLVVSAYRQLLEKRGAIVKVQTNLQLYNNII